MRVPLILLALLGAGVGAITLSSYLMRPALPAIPAIPEDVTDPAIRTLWAERRAAVEADSYSAEAWGAYGIAFDAHYRGDLALECYRVAQTLNPMDVRWPYFQARRLREMTPLEAIKLLELARTLPMPSPEHRVACDLTLAELYDDNGRTVEAQALTQSLLAEHDKHDWVQFRVGAAELDQNNAAGVSRLMRLAQNPAGQRKSAALLAAYYRRMGDVRSAQGFEYASSLLPRDQFWPNPFETELNQAQRGERALVELESRQGELRNFAGSLATAHKLAEEYPSARSQLVLGRALVQSHDPAGAVTVLSDAIAAEPDLTMAHAFLGVARFQLAERARSRDSAEAKQLYQDAVAAFDRAIALKSDYAPGYYYRAQSLVKLNRANEALQAIEDFLAHRPEEWEGHLVQAELYEALGRKPEAIQAAERAVQLANPSEPRPKAKLAQLKEKTP